MPIATNFERERSELEAVLASGIFSRAPSLAQLLTYICDRYFDGQANQIKEYNIAVDALGRPPTFDQKKDSIVRVEAHRLRKRLKEFYEGPGAAHPVRIEIPSGQYVPRFVPVDSPFVLPPGNPDQAVMPVPPGAAPVRELQTIERPQREFSAIVRGHRPGRWGVALVASALLCFGILALVYVSRARAHSSAPAGTAVDVPSTGETIRILAGATQPYTDRFGQTWSPDRYFRGGKATSVVDHVIFNTRDRAMYWRCREGAFSYDIPLHPGPHELRLHFAEVLFGESNIAGGGETSRLFNVSANGKPLLQELDVVADAGPSSPSVRVFKDIYPASDGSLHLRFDPVVNAAFVNAIEISPGIAGRLQPIRIVAQDRGYIDKAGHLWSADRYVIGGQHVMRPITVTGAPDPEIYRGERYGNISYSIPVAPSRYTLVLHFAETWFGPAKPQPGGAGSRVFDILANGIALARDFDIYKEAGGSDRALDRIYHGLEPTPQGKLVISLVPKRNYGCINALEVLDESGT